ncbi:phosphatase PAP2 family protein [Yeosuana sp. MJ-SS3]|uniref:Phosphatase PAP2 family protein n=1 Tax=Gilvirhabdus luticola TaxID=3079858 RepID=A0ABU3U3S4_9FLAO|nr:phosphatase PAP2 family protein [Yeosuana sp. MJ-SS3]MDU8885053.1 phosphatase PAP2 family protein [Yeosuana sp. MJ-SS3]
MKFRIKQLLVCTFFIIAISCKKEAKEIVITANNYHNAVDQLTAVMVHDIFPPPVASRIFAYSNIAAYEVMCQESSEYKTLANQVTELKPVPKAGNKENINFKLAALVAYLDVGKELIFSEDRIITYRDSLYNSWENLDKDTFEASKNHGLLIAKHIKDWIATDNYKETRTMPKFTVNSEDPSRWQPTPPDYMDGIEPHWNKIRPFVIDSASQFIPEEHPKFSLEKDSDFYNELLEVYNVGKEIKKGGDGSEEIAIAQFWDCNPYVSTHKGHLMFATKKITPGAHWMGICKIVCKKDQANFEKSIYAYTKTSMAIADGFISAWDEKYRSNLIRPETLINQYVDENWTPLLQTPPFPEYTSAHSVISGAAAISLASIFGDNFSFDDDTELVYGLPVRHFSSFSQASNEAAISRLYGGIHYRTATQTGLTQGRNLGKFVVEHLDMEVNN